MRIDHEVSHDLTTGKNNAIQDYIIIMKGSSCADDIVGLCIVCVWCVDCIDFLFGKMAALPPSCIMVIMKYCKMSCTQNVEHYCLAKSELPGRTI